MRTLLASIIFLSCLGVNAGRESHGFLPFPYQCQKSPADKGRLNVTFNYSGNEITSVQLTAAGQIQPEIPCIDYYSSRTLQANMQVTAVCAAAQDRKYVVELNESQTAAEAKVWTVELDHSTTLVDTLPCD